MTFLSIIIVLNIFKTIETRTIDDHLEFDEDVLYTLIPKVESDSNIGNISNVHEELFKVREANRKYLEMRDKHRDIIRKFILILNRLLDLRKRISKAEEEKDAAEREMEDYRVEGKPQDALNISMKIFNNATKYLNLLHKLYEKLSILKTKYIEEIDVSKKDYLALEHKKYLKELDLLNIDLEIAEKNRSIQYIHLKLILQKINSSRLQKAKLMDRMAEKVRAVSETNKCLNKSSLIIPLIEEVVRFQGIINQTKLQNAVLLVQYDEVVKITHTVEQKLNEAKVCVNKLKDILRKYEEYIGLLNLRIETEKDLSHSTHELNTCWTNHNNSISRKNMAHQRRYYGFSVNDTLFALKILPNEFSTMNDSVVGGAVYCRKIASRIDQLNSHLASKNK